MPSLLLHAAAVDRLAAQGEALPPRLGAALVEDLEYARLGAFLPDLPLYGNLKPLRLAPVRDPLPKFALLFHQRAPVTMGLKLAELCSNGALVGTDAGFALLCGYFTHLAVDRALTPIEQRLAERYRGRTEPLSQALERIQWIQGLCYLEAQHGRDLAGDALLRRKLQVHKRPALARGMGRGFYELLRLATLDALGEAPGKPEVDGWMRGLSVHALVISSPLGRTRSLANVTALERRELYLGPDVDYAATVEAALGEAQAVLQRVWSYMHRGLFTRRSRERFLALFPEGAVSACAA